jgi:hypothetical protein
MRICFVCGSDKLCAHREMELLPPNARAREGSQISRAEYLSSTVFSTGSQDPLTPQDLEIIYETNPTKDIRRKAVIKSPRKAVDACGKKLHAPNSGKR